MAEAETNTADQCQALTSDGERCSRPAQDDGFCYQHDESDSTVSDNDTETEDDEQDDEAQADDQSEGDDDQDARSAEMATEEATDPDDVDTSDVDADEGREQLEGVLAIRRTVESSAGKLIGHEFDGVSEISPMDEGWRAVVEVVERSAVPDTQDIIGRYEIELDAGGAIQGYRRLDRYRRGDTKMFE
jgi:hypothetical protein